MNLWIYIVLYIAIVLIITFIARKKESSSEFMIGGRKLGVWEVTLSILAVFGGLELVGQASLAFEVGYHAMWFWFGISIGILLLGLMSRKLKKLADQEKFITISDYFHHKYGKIAGTIAAVIIFTTFFSLLVGQIVAGASLIAPLLNIAYTRAVGILCIITLSYLALGGFKAVTKTDLFQGAITIVILLLLLSTVGVDKSFISGSNFGSVGVYGILSFLFIGIFAIFAGADIWQRVYAAKNHSVIKKAFSLSSLLIIIFGFAVTLVGMIAKTSSPNIVGDEALYYGLFELLPVELFGLGIILLIAIIMSAMDTQIFVLSSSIAKDFTVLGKKRNDNDMKRYTTIAFFFVTIAAAVVSLYISNILVVLYGLLSLMLSLSPSVIFSFFVKLNKNAVIASMLSGTFSLIVIAVMGVFTPENAVITLPSALIVLLVGQMISFFNEKTIKKTPKT